MEITPSRADLENWFDRVPSDGDLVFISDDKSALLKDQPFPLRTRDDVKAQGLKIWTLNRRSWYGYALNQADNCVWLPNGALESFDKTLKEQMAEEQRRLKVPTLIEDRWITAFAWSQMSVDERISTLQAWAIQNEIHSYESVEFNNLPLGVQAELRRIGYDGLINRYAKFSGPNCFATAAGAIVSEDRAAVRDRWLHWPELEIILYINNYVIPDSDVPKCGDVLVFLRGEIPIHAAYFLGDDFYFEKPGQDFHEPYRVAAFEEWRRDWPGSKLVIWRKG